jgi:hypothetical protein
VAREVYVLARNLKVFVFLFCPGREWSLQHFFVFFSSSISFFLTQHSHMSDSAAPASAPAAAPAAAGTGSKTPADFLKSIKGRSVIVKLNSGSDYRGED